MVLRWWTWTLSSGLSFLICSASLSLRERTDLSESMILKHEELYWRLQAEDFWRCLNMWECLSVFVFFFFFFLLLNCSCPPHFINNSASCVQCLPPPLISHTFVINHSDTHVWEFLPDKSYTCNVYQVTYKDRL